MSTSEERSAACKVSVVCCKCEKTLTFEAVRPIEFQDMGQPFVPWEVTTPAQKEYLHGSIARVDGLKNILELVNHRIADLGREVPAFGKSLKWVCKSCR